MTPPFPMVLLIPPASHPHLARIRARDMGHPLGHPLLFILKGGGVDP